MLLASLGTSIANVALPALARSFSSTFAEVQAVVVVYLAAMTTSALAAGRLGDRLGLKPAMLMGLGLFLAASLACALAPGLWWLVGARAVQGVGAAFLLTLSMALARQSASKPHLGRAMGLLGTVSALGTALGPALAGLLIPATGWRGIFWVQIPLAAIALVLSARALPNETRKKVAAPERLRHALNRGLLPNLLVNLLVAAVMMTTLVVGPFYLGLGLGLKEMQVGAVMAIGPAISIAGGIPSGRLVDAWGSARVLLLGLGLLATGALLLSLLANMMGVIGYVISIMVLTPGYQLFQAANNTAALADVPAHRSGTVSGALSLSRNIGLSAGASVMGMIFAFGVGTEDIVGAAPAAVQEGMQLTFLVACAMVILAIGVDTVGRRSWRAPVQAERE